MKRMKHKPKETYDNEFFAHDGYTKDWMADAKQAYDEYSDWANNFNKKIEAELKSQAAEGDENTDTKKLKQCFVCGKPLAPDSDLYCSKHHFLAAIDAQKLRDAEPKEFAYIAAAAVEEEMKEYRKLLWKMYENPFNKKTIADIIHFERWLLLGKPIKRKDGKLLRPSFDQLSMGLAEDPVRIIQVAHDQVRAEWREKQKNDIIRAYSTLTKPLYDRVKALEKEVKELKKICQEKQSAE